MQTTMQEVEEFVRHIDLSEALIRERLAEAGVDPAVMRTLRAFGADLDPAEVESFAADYFAQVLRRDVLEGRVPSAEEQARIVAAIAHSLQGQLTGPLDLSYVRGLILSGIIHSRMGLSPQWSLGLRPTWLHWALRHPSIQAHPSAPAALAVTSLFDNGWVLDAYLFENERLERARLAMADKVLELVPAGVLYTDSNLRITQHNPAMLTILGADQPTLRGRLLPTLLPVEEDARRVLDSGEPARTLRLEQGGKTLRLALARVDKPQRCLVLMAEDLTHEVTQRTRIEASERRLHAVLEHAGEGVIIIGQDGMIELFNQAAEAIFGVPRHQLIGQPFTALVPEDARERHREHLREFLATLDPQHLGGRRPASVTRPDGQRVDLDILVTAHEIDQRLVITVFLRDITEQQRAQDALRRSEHNLRALIETIPDAVAVHRANHFVFVNPAMALLLGYDSPDELLGRSPIEIVHPDDRPVVTERIQRLALTGAPVPVLEERYLRADGEVIHAEVAALGVEYEGAPATLVIGRDITQRRALTARMMRMDRMIAVGTLAAGVGHEINNPLTFVVANVADAQERVTQLRRALDLPHPAVFDQARHTLDELDELLAEVSTGSERIRDIVHDLRVFSREDTRPRRPLDILAPLDFALSIADNEIKHRATLVRDLAPAPLVLANESQLSQVFINLLVNAAQAIDRGDQADNQITVRVRPGEDRVIIEVADTGEGIEPGELPHLFDPFFTTKPVGQGTGLGLSICQRIVHDHGGELQVESTPGQGSCFRVLLPVAAHTVERPAVQPPDPPTVDHPGRVLFIDDEPAITRLATRALGRRHEVVAAGDATEAAALIENGPPFDVVFCDLMMPGLSGAELYEMVLASSPEQAARFVFITGGAFTPDTWTFLEQTSQPHLNKPFSPGDLRQAATRMVQLHR